MTRLYLLCAGVPSYMLKICLKASIGVLVPYLHTRKRVKDLVAAVTVHLGELQALDEAAAASGGVLRACSTVVLVA